MPLLHFDDRRETVLSPVCGAIRGLVALLEQTQHLHAASLADRDATEQVLVDIDVDDARYLLIRMPQPVKGRVLLSPREQEIVRMVAQGHPNKVIADVLSISPWTVCTHLRRIFAKLLYSTSSSAVPVGASRTIRLGTDRDVVGSEGTPERRPA